MASHVNELAHMLKKSPDAVRAQLGYHKITVRGKTLKQLMKEMRKRELIPEGVIESDGLPPDIGHGNGHGNGQSAKHPAEANLANRLHGIRARLEQMEPLANKPGGGGLLQFAVLSLLHYARTGQELDIQTLVRDMKNS